jgi:hypothetical protein|tara:strand:+ start:753 stop:1055 length:303 start_codon:yes stop_codon:yes gene_type:complete
MKVGISLRIDVTKIDKSRLYKGAKGTYLDLTTFVDTMVTDEYDNNGRINQSLTKEEREAKVQTPILGNVKVFYTDGSQTGIEKPAVADMSIGDLDDDIPF